MSSDSNDLTSIKVKKSTKARFDVLGNISMTQDDLLNALIDCWNQAHGIKEEKK